MAWSASLSESKPCAFDELAHEHLLGGQLGDDARHDDERVASEDAVERALVLRLELVVELVVDPQADLLGRVLDVQPGRDPLHQPQDQPEVLHVRPHRGGDAGVLDLDRHVAAVVQLGAVDLADRGGGDRVGVELGEVILELAAELGLDHLAHAARSSRSARSRAAAASLRWNSSRCSSGTSPTSRKLITCPSFIAAPFIVPSAVTICSAASTWRRSSAADLALFRAPDVRRPRAQVARRLARREAGHLRRAGDARGRDLVLGH